MVQSWALLAIAKTQPKYIKLDESPVSTEVILKSVFKLLLILNRPVLQKQRIILTTLSLVHLMIFDPISLFCNESHCMVYYASKFCSAEFVEIFNFFCRGLRSVSDLAFPSHFEDCASLSRSNPTAHRTADQSKVQCPKRNSEQQQRITRVTRPLQPYNQSQLVVISTHSDWSNKVCFSGAASVKPTVPDGRHFMYLWLSR